MDSFDGLGVPDVLGKGIVGFMLGVKETVGDILVAVGIEVTTTDGSGVRSDTHPSTDELASPVLTTNFISATNSKRYTQNK